MCEQLTSRVRTQTQSNSLMEQNTFYNVYGECLISTRDKIFHNI